MTIPVVHGPASGDFAIGDDRGGSDGVPKPITDEAPDALIDARKRLRDAARSLVLADLNADLEDDSDESIGAIIKARVGLERAAVDFATQLAAWGVR